MADKKRHNAGAWDIRAIIAYLLIVYGLVLVYFGLFDFSDAEKEKAADYNVNLWGGLGMLLVAAAFLIWNKLNPTKVPDEPTDGESTSSTD